MQENTIETGARLLKLYPNLSVLFGTTFLSSIEMINDILSPA
jgi:hypothetical protein